METALWVWYKTSEGAEAEGGHVVAWTTNQEVDEQGTPVGEPTTTLVGLADPIVAATIVEQGRADGALVWICPDFEAKPTLDNLLAIWGDDVVSTAVTHNGTNPTITQEVPSDTGTGEPTAGAQSLPEADWSRKNPGSQLSPEDQAQAHGQIAL
jgi:hypothetical protein